MTSFCIDDINIIYKCRIDNKQFNVKRYEYNKCPFIVALFIKNLEVIYLNGYNQRVEITKRMLKEGLLRLLKITDIQKISITELCRESGINRATFYRHYSTPHDLLLEISMDILEETEQCFGTLENINDSQKYLTSLCRYFYENADIIQILIRNHSDSDFSHILDKFYQNMLKTVHKSTPNPLLDNDSIKLLSTCFAGGVYFLLRRWLMEDINKTPEEVAELIFRFINKDYPFL